MTDSDSLNLTDLALESKDLDSIDAANEPFVGKLVSPELVTDDLPATTESQLDDSLVELPASTSHQSLETSAIEQPKSWFRRTVAWVSWCFRSLFCIASLIVLLAFLTAIPIVQLIAFGYLLRVAGNLTAGAKFRDALPHLQEAGQIGLALTALFLAALPTQLLAHEESVAEIVSPGSSQATLLRWLSIASSLLAIGYLMWAWARGGRLVHYLWPQPKRFFREGFRLKTWSSLPDRLWNFTTSLELPTLFWLGLRGAAGTLVWLIPAFIIITAFREGETGLAGLVGFLSLILLGISMLYLPMLQAHFAAENRLRALFDVRTIRRDFRHAPWAWLGAMICSMVILPIPLYLLKIEATPREVMWLPCLVFVAFILPARVAAGLALRRARHRAKVHGEPTGRWNTVSRWLVRLIMPAVVGVYLLFVYVSQYTSWDGYLTWVQQHAILIPVPFLSGT
ncbi:hypothetical protein Pla22_11440 [Rubripirellula amarantea]|uniref:DUF4013 domain-containing protein n=1 Tax=Rubripirellula amarantea TaxID=2527999 RepID=A0A5C5WTP1_9BACT|nr:DUF4013 domain-containing protein [Rubripirellula amarantea]TWT53515.1 hypothetical protein Pla22_11440 [Rubripirellula amarantea]